MTAACALDSSQRAVLAADPARSISVVGAAGSGKTTTLIELAAHRVHLGTLPDELVALVTDRRRATWLRDRLSERIARATGGVLARTPQSLAFQIVRRHRAACDEPPPRLVTGADQDALLRELIEGRYADAPPAKTVAGWADPVTPELLRLRGFRAEMRDLLAVMSEFDISPRDLLELSGRHPLWAGAAGLARELQESLDWQGGGAFDTPGLLLEAASLVRGEPASAAQVPRLVLVDDAQELTEAARRFVAALEAAGAVVVAFGDPDTATGVFRGGRAEHAVSWRGRAAAPERILLDRVHRHGAQLRGIVSEVIARIGVRGEGRQRRAAAAAAEAEREHPAGEPTAGERPAPERSAGAGSVRERSAEAQLERPARERPAGAEAEREQPSGNQPMRELPAGKQSVREQPAGKTPGREEPVRELPAGEEPARKAQPSPLPVAAKLFAATPVAEAQAIAGLLRERHLGDGIAWDAMAVIVRSGAAIPPLARLLARAEVPTAAARPEPASEDAAVQCLISLAQVAADAAAGTFSLSAGLVADALESPLLGVDALRLRQLRRALRFEELAAGGQRLGDELLVEAIAAPAGLAGVAVADDPLMQDLLGRFGEHARFREHAAVVAAARLGGMLRRATTIARQAGAADEVLWALWEGAGVAERWRRDALGEGPDAERAGARLDAIVTLFDVAKRFVERAPDAPIGAFLEEWRGRDLADDTLARRAQRPAVVLATPASLVGREFDTVVVAGVNDAVWPDTRIRDTLLGAQQLAAIAAGLDEGREHADRRREVLDDERRMFAQAISRARARLFITAVNGEDAQPSIFAHAIEAPRIDPAELPGPGTLRSLAARLRREAARSAGGDEAAIAGLAELARHGCPGAHPAGWRGLAPRTTLAPVTGTDEAGQPVVRVSPSAIAAFETCGVNWFVSSRGGEAPSLPMALGTIAHEAAEHDFPDAAARRAHAHARLASLRFDAPWQAAQQRAALDAVLDALEAYLRDRRRRSVVVLGIERAFAIDIAAAGSAEPRIELSGKIDRIERDEDGTITILDFKTAKRAPAKDAVTSDPQLASYQLAYREGAIGPRRERPAAPGAPQFPIADDGREVPRDAPLGGAGLIMLRVRSGDEPWKQIGQEPMSEDAQAAFRERVREIALGMTGPAYLADPEGHCRSDYQSGNCRIHVVPEITE